jgi:hypothetical protein
MLRHPPPKMGGIPGYRNVMQCVTFVGVETTESQRAGFRKIRAPDKTTLSGAKFQGPPQVWAPGVAGHGLQIRPKKFRKSRRSDDTGGANQLVASC